MNDYLIAFKKAGGGSRLFDFEDRNNLTSKYAWAVPTDDAIAVLVEYSPVIEIGAGNGYWASLIAKAGGKIDAYDKKPYENNWIGKYSIEKYYPVKKGGIEKLSLPIYKNWTLFLCWAPYDDPFALNALRAYQGNTFIFIGESEGGCTGNDEFFKELYSNWDDVKTLGLPQWFGIHDRLTIWDRKSEVCKE